MASSPVVSVIMAVRDGERWLREAIDSILTQTFSDFEFLIVDDGSRDETPEILAAYRARDPRVHVIAQAKEGFVRALNRGLAAATGALIARLDADDVALPERLRRQVDYLAAHPDVVLLGTWTQVIDEEGQPKRRHLRPPTDAKSLARVMARTNPFIHSSAMFRTALARELGGYRQAFYTAEDYDLWLRLSERGEIAILPEVLVRYRQHGGSMSSTKAVRQVFSFRLARRVSEARRRTGHDPASALSAPPDWRIVDDNAFYADDAKLCRVLELADPAIARGAALASIDVAAVSRRLPELIYIEKKLAQLALINLMRAGVPVPGYSKRSLLALVFRLHPTRALRLIWPAL